MVQFQEKQIRDRVAFDDAQLTNATLDLAAVLMGEKVASEYVSSEQTRTRSAVDEICRFYGIARDAGDDFDTEGDDWLERLLRPSGVMWRHVSLEGAWWKNASEAMLCKTKAGGYVALVPTLSGYRFFDYGRRQKVRMNARAAEALEGDAICFYRPLPNDATDLRGIVRFLFERTEKADFSLVLLATVAVALVGLALPWANEFIFSHVIPSGRLSELGAIAALLVGVSLSTILFGILKSLAETRIATKLQIVMESAVFGKLINMPPVFFKGFSAGDLSNRMNNLSSVASLVVSVAFTTSFASIFSVVYVAQIFSIAPSLALPAIVAIALQVAVGLLGVRLEQALMRRRLPLANRLSALVFSLFSGIQKLRLSGAEKRAFAKWADIYKEQARCDYNPPVLLKLMPALNAVVGIAGLLFIYFVAATSGVDVPQYFAFMTAFGQVSGALIPIVGIVGTMANIKPILEIAKPLLEEPSELGESKEILRSLGGSIRIEGVSFAYEKDAPPVLDNLDLTIRRGEYLALVGKTGCGKSTLLRLLLGFEAPQAGAIYYDEKDMGKLDLKSLRGNIGVVLQTGDLFQGDIFSNIGIAAPQITLKEAWEAAEMAGVAADIRAMPMGMRTMVSEGSGGLSGGQKQRIMIARAIASKPSILMFDEATSALDNITQRQVSESLAALRSTRIIVAHRLSTIKEADRIVVLEDGAIAEDGSYDDLVAQGGLFADLVRRQQLD
ncbi:MAG: ATP-binding cassette domain-containing protein [Coriobacteriales bacterium]|jgi:NHLM bacteriocin system ABC transporter ATP-binding protein|nr:ATP-binding cassette domain-containing protein [Coriobacteriales bacterium]